ncbi:MAG: hypothetical protein KGL39_14035 [Patescibacteria group bacterium]|nr:hypothetical protein [Patescibacteria group bacterium]
MANLMVGHQPKPTPADLKRYRALQDLGCVACYLSGVRHVPCEIHHIVEGNKRLGNQASLSLCPYHHRGVIESVWDRFKGPSLANDKRKFVAEFGTERELLSKVNQLIGDLCY